MNSLTGRTVGLGAAVAALGLAAYFLAVQPGGPWPDPVIASLAEWSVRAAGSLLVPAWLAGDQAAVAANLEALTGDGPLVAAAACNPDFSVFARTANYPAQYSCEALRQHADQPAVWTSGGLRLV